MSFLKFKEPFERFSRFWRARELVKHNLSGKGATTLEVCSHSQNRRALDGPSGGRPPDPSATGPLTAKHMAVSLWDHLKPPSRRGFSFTTKSPDCQAGDSQPLGQPQNPDPEEIPWLPQKVVSLWDNLMSWPGATTSVESYQGVNDRRSQHFDQCRKPSRRQW